MNTFNQSKRALKLPKTQMERGAMMWRGITKFMLVIFILLIGSAAVAKDTKPPSGTVEINETQFGIIIGGSVGGGTLRFKGGSYPFKTSGLKVGTIGVAKVAAVGEVYDLKRVSDFPGTYVKASADIALGGGVGGLILKNEHDVVMRLVSTLKGVSLTVGVEGLTVKME
ncbi:MAG: DUF1134 domain-containing protein [Candidatus Dadabacteria bacterium]|nr:DUF1134 domain-containing protein [Candidatus Dadabacteria bacterium]